jgi:peptidyl-prolyl cis-trans isomerase B (cyclophilin B)
MIRRTWWLLALSGWFASLPVVAQEEAGLPAEVAGPVVEEKQKEEIKMVIIRTNKGDMKVKLFDKEAPVTVENFLAYVDSGHYAGTIFHRVIDNFMIQGGGFTPEMEQKPTRAPIKNEATNRVRNSRGTIAMARTQIIDSATSQFFINVKDNQFLDHRDTSAQGFGYCVFGEVVEGLDVVDAIKGVKTGRVGGFADVPVEQVVIESVDRVEE